MNLLWKKDANGVSYVNIFKNVPKYNLFNDRAALSVDTIAAVDAVDSVKNMTWGRKNNEAAAVFRMIGNKFFEKGDYSSAMCN